MKRGKGKGDKEGEEGEEGLADLKNKTVLVTGGNAGIGFQTAVKLAKAQATTIIACRDEKKAITAVELIKQQSNNDRVEYMLVDLQNFDSIDQFGKRFKEEKGELNVLVNNAGMLASSLSSKSKDGFELTFGVNVLGPFLLTLHLLPCLIAAENNIKKKSRIIFVSSLMHAYGRIDVETLQMWRILLRHYQLHSIPPADRSYPLSSLSSPSPDLNSLYSNTKLANILLAKEFDKRLEGKGVRSYSLNPGAVRTDILKDFGWFIRVFGGWVLDCCASIGLFMKTAENGANTSFLLCYSKQFEEKGGCYFSDEKIKKPADHALDPFAASSLFDHCAHLVEAEKRVENWEKMSSSLLLPSSDFSSLSPSPSSFFLYLILATSFAVLFLAYFFIF